jgi:transcriptional regulator with XRE-family HTH domain
VNEFGKVLRQARLASEKTLENLAKRIGCSIPYLSDVERGNRAPFDAARIHLVAACLGADVHDLLVAAAKNEGVFRLEAHRSEQHDKTGGLLMRRWNDMVPDELDAIATILAPYASSSQTVLPLA